MADITNVPVDPTLPSVELNLGGKTYYLCFTFKALTLVKAKLKEAGINISMLQALDLSTFDVDRVGPMLYAALITHQPELNYIDVLNMIQFRDLGTIMKAISDAYTESLAEPSSDAGESPNEQPEKADS